MRKPSTQMRVLYPALAAGRCASLLGNRMEALACPQCSSVTRSQLTNAQGRGPAQTPGHLRRAQGRCGAGQQAAAVARCSAASCGKLQVTVTYFSDLLNQTQVFSSHVPASPAALHVRPLSHAPGKPTSHVCAFCPTLL